MKISIKLKTMILLGGFLCVISLIIAANFWVNRLQKNYALLINLTGRQRMLTQKMTKEAFGITRESEILDKTRMMVNQLIITRNHLAKTIADQPKFELNEYSSDFLPAKAARKIAEGLTKGTHIVFKQTSLKTRNPQNKPDSFETKILQMFEENRKLEEFHETVSENGKKYLRYMKRLVVVKPCLKCHGPKGSAPSFVLKNYLDDQAFDYKEGDIRGAISLMVPIYGSVADHRGSLAKTRGIFDMTLNALENGGNTVGAGGAIITLRAETNKEILSKLGNASALWKDFDRHISVLLKPELTIDSNEFSNAFLFIESNNETLLNAMNNITELYQKEADGVVSLLETLQFWTLIISLAIAAGAFWVINYTVIKPVENMADDLNAVATGDLTVESKVKSSDEIGNMAVSLNQMTANLRGMLTAISSTSSNVAFISETISSTTQELNAGAEIQSSAITMTSSSIDEMNSSVKEIAGNTSKLSYKAEEVASTTLEMSASIDEVARIAEELSYTVDEVTSSITELSSSVREITEHASQLSTSTEETAASVSEINASIKEVESNLKVSANLSEATAVDAEAGMEAFNKTIEGMKNIKETVDTSAAVIKRLGAKSEAIGEILHVINEVAEQTNLLALNAAIIAAQAGEHGKGFSVVADEIKGLANRTTVSTKEIEALIKGVQSEVKNAVKSIEAGGKSVEAGMKVSNLAGNALEKILSSAISSRQMVEQISRASAEQLKGSQQASEAMEKITDMIKMVFRAIEDQEKGSAYISQAAEKMRDAATHVKKTTKEQSHNGEFISKSIEKMADMTNSIHRATSEQASESQKIVKAVSEIKEITERNVAGIGKMHGATETLVGQSSVLEDTVKKFKV